MKRVLVLTKTCVGVLGGPREGSSGCGALGVAWHSDPEPAWSPHAQRVLIQGASVPPRGESAQGALERGGPQGEACCWSLPLGTSLASFLGAPKVNGSIHLSPGRRFRAIPQHARIPRALALPEGFSKHPSDSLNKLDGVGCLVVGSWKAWDPQVGYGQGIRVPWKKRSQFVLEKANHFR